MPVGLIPIISNIQFMLMRTVGIHKASPKPFIWVLIDFTVLPASLFDLLTLFQRLLVILSRAIGTANYSAGTNKRSDFYEQ